MKLITLSLFYDGSKVYVNPENICAIFSDGKGITELLFAGGDGNNYVTVKESVETVGKMIGRAWGCQREPDCLIDRQAAIDAVTAWLHKASNPLNRSEYNEGEVAAYETALSELKEIPSAQPETNCSEIPNNSDTISRQTALDEIRRFAGYLDEDMINRIHIALKRLPSAQPETATVTIGKTRGTDVLWYQCDGCGEPVAKEDCYCSKCGRRLRFEQRLNQKAGCD